MNINLLRFVFVNGAIFLGAIFCSCIQNEHEHQAVDSSHGHTSGHEHHSGATSEQVPEVLSEILWQIDQKRTALNEAIATGNLADVHPIAFALRDLFIALSEKASELGDLGALSETDRKKLQAGVKNVAALADQLDQFGDAGDLSGVIEQNRQMQTLVKFLRALFGEEGHSMSELPHSDHDAKHGGVLGMAGDRHIELVDNGKEFRVYLYDAYTQPVSAAAGVTGELIVNSSNPQSVKLQLALAPGSAYLVAPHREDLQAIEATVELKINNENITLTFPLLMELEGRLVDVGCFARDGLAALRDDHQACTKTCIEAGAPVGIVTDETDPQSLYLVTLREDGSVHAANQRLLDFLHQKIRISGKVFKSKGLKVIELSEVESLD